MLNFTNAHFLHESLVPEVTGYSAECLYGGVCANCTLIGCHVVLCALTAVDVVSSAERKKILRDSLLNGVGVGNSLSTDVEVKSFEFRSSFLYHFNYKVILCSPCIPYADKPNISIKFKTSIIIPMCYNSYYIIYLKRSDYGI
jgi:hypothetical protein